MINCPKEFELDTLNSFCVTRLKKNKIHKGSVGGNSFNITPKELNISQAL